MSRSRNLRLEDEHLADPTSSRGERRREAGSPEPYWHSSDVRGGAGRMPLPSAYRSGESLVPDMSTYLRSLYFMHEYFQKHALKITHNLTLDMKYTLTNSLAH